LASRVGQQGPGLGLVGRSLSGIALPTRTHCSAQN
jgi:hypothetical protein